MSRAAPPSGTNTRAAVDRCSCFLLVLRQRGGCEAKRSTPGFISQQRTGWLTNNSPYAVPSSPTHLAHGRTIPDFAREADFLRLLPRGADIDPNDPRHGNLMRLRGLLSTLDLDRRESSVVARGPRAGSGLGPTRRPASARGGAGAGAGNEGAEDGGEEEDTGVFRASQEQQALVFAGKRIASGLPGGAGRADVGGGRGEFRTFAFNNHRR